MSINKIAGPGAADPAAFASKIVKKLDTNADGGIDKNEFVSGLTANGVSAQEAAKQFDKIDTSKSGKISQADIEAALKTHAGKGPPPGGRPEGAGKGEHPEGAGKGGGAAPAAKTYAAADSNQDGTVSEQEALLYALSHSADATAVKAIPATSAQLGGNVDELA